MNSDTFEIISSPDMRSLVEDYNHMIKSQNKIGEMVSKLGHMTTDLSDRVTVLMVIAIILCIIVFLYAIITIVMNAKRKSKQPARRRSNFVEELERMAFVRTEELFSGVKFESPINKIKVARGYTELYYIAFQIATCELDFDRIVIPALSKVSERNDTIRFAILKTDTPVFSDVESMVLHVKEAMKLGSPFALSSEMRSVIGSELYEELVKQKMVPEEILKWLADAKEIIELSVEERKQRI